MSAPRPRSASPQKISLSLESSIIEKQRQELQVLVAELKDHDRELNDMVAVHRRQFLEWANDRQKILTLAERCSLLDNELKGRNEIIKSLTKRLKLIESHQSDSKTTLENTQQKFKELSQKVADVILHCRGLEEENQSLHCSVLELSAKTGQLQAREQELLTMLKLKDDYINEFTSKFKKLESALLAAKAEQFSLNKEKEDLRLRLKELVIEANELKDDLCEKKKENNKQQEEIIHLKQENVFLKNELAHDVENAKRKDQLLQFAKSKQARTDAELSSLRQIYIKQQRDLQFLHVSLESSQEQRQKHQKEAHERSIGVACPAPDSHSETASGRTGGAHGTLRERGTAYVPRSRVKSSSEMCGGDNGLLLEASDLEKTTSACFSWCLKVVKGLAVPVEEEKQDVASSSDEVGSEVFDEANNTRPLRNTETSENGVESRDQQALESSSPEHWLNVSSCAGSQSSLVQSTTTSDRTGKEDETWEERSGIVFSQKGKEPPAAIHKSESNSFSNYFTINNDARWKPVSDPDWLKIFKPIKGNGSKWESKDCNSLETTEEMKCASSKSEENVNLNSFHLDSPCCLTSTQKGDRPQRCEEFSDANCPLDISNLSGIEPKNRCCNPTTTKDASSPLSKLQRTLAKSQQMVASLSSPPREPSLQSRQQHGIYCSPTLHSGGWEESL